MITSTVDPSFVDNLKQNILASSEDTLRAHRILRIINGPDSWRRTQHITAWESSVREHYNLGVGSIDWATVLQWAKVIANIIGFILMLLPLFATEAELSDVT